MKSYLQHPIPINKRNAPSDLLFRRHRLDVHAVDAGAELVDADGPVAVRVEEREDVLHAPDARVHPVAERVEDLVALLLRRRSLTRLLIPAATRSQSSHIIDNITGFVVYLRVL